MKRLVGKVIDVFIPEQYKNGNLLDIMDRTNIGFIVETDEGIKEIIVEQDEFNTDIIINDKVLITWQNILGKDYVDIELTEGENND